MATLPYSCLENPMDRGTWQSMGLQRVGHDFKTEQEQDIDTDSLKSSQSAPQALPDAPFHDVHETKVEQRGTKTAIKEEAAPARELSK